MVHEVLVGRLPAHTQNAVNHIQGIGVVNPHLFFLVGIIRPGVIEGHAWKRAERFNTGSACAAFIGLRELDSARKGERGNLTRCGTAAAPARGNNREKPENDYQGQGQEINRLFP